MDRIPGTAPTDLLQRTPAAGRSSQQPAVIIRWLVITEVAMGRRPTSADVRARFWSARASRASYGEAARAAAVSRDTGHRWIPDSGGSRPRGRRPRPVSRLSLTERQEIFRGLAARKTLTRSPRAWAGRHRPSARRGRPQPRPSRRPGGAGRPAGRGSRTRSPKPAPVTMAHLITSRGTPVQRVPANAVPAGRVRGGVWRLPVRDGQLPPRE
jgi:hypothetical protein